METRPLLIVLQIYPGDQLQGLGLTKLIADIEPEVRIDVEFMVAYKRDCSTKIVEEIISEASRSFKVVRSIRCKRFGSSWPVGPNDLWQDTMTSISVMSKNERLNVSGVLTFEPDCIPLRPDWLDCLIREWKNRRPGNECVGHLHGDGKEQGMRHINGNGMFDPYITRNHQELSGSDGIAGWDCYHAHTLLKVGQDTNFIFQIYKAEGLDIDDVRAIRKGNVIPALFHGIKGDSGIKIVREMIENGDFTNRPSKL